MEERKAVWVILFTIRCASLTLSRDERFQAVWVIFFRIRSTSLTLNRMNRIVWVILFRIRDVQVLPWTGRKGWQSGSSCSESDTYIYSSSLTLNKEERKAVWVILFRRMVTLSWSISGVTSRTYRRQVAFTSFFPSDDKKMHCNLYSQDCQLREKANCCSMEKEHCIFFSIFN